MSVDIKHMDVITDASSVSVHRKFRMTRVASAARWLGIGRRYLNQAQLSEYRGFW
jgi:hypothetical protein